MNNTPPPPSRLPILMSAVVYPGAGQFMQKRHAVAWMYLLCFTTVGLIFLIALIRDICIALTALRDAIETGIAPAGHVVDWKPVLKLGGVTFVVYAANVYDAWYAWHRSKKSNIEH